MKRCVIRVRVPTHLTNQIPPQFREYLRAHGYDTTQMGLTDADSDYSESAAENDVVVDKKESA